MRYLTIIATVIVLLGVGVAGYFFFFNEPATVTVVPGGGLPSAGESGLPAEPDFGTVPEQTTEVVSNRLVRISAGPVVPGFAITTKTGSSTETMVSYIDRASGHVFSYSPETRTTTRTSNRTIPGIQSALWLADGASAVVRYLSADTATTNSYVLRADGSEGFFLPQNLSGVTSASSTIFSLVSGTNGSTVSSHDSRGSRSTELFSTPLSAVHLNPLGRSSFLLTTKASATLPGFSFLTTNRGETSRIVGPLLGLSILQSPSGEWLLASHTVSGELRVALIEVATRKSTLLPISTLVEKCAWAPDSRSLYCGVPTSLPRATYPDDWYQGAVHFTDRIWKVDVAGRYAQLLLNFSEETEGSLDATALATNVAGTLLVFLNKNDGSVWSYAL